MLIKTDTSRGLRKKENITIAVHSAKLSKAYSIVNASLQQT